jgi:hypothetical protein
MTGTSWSAAGEGVGSGKVRSRLWHTRKASQGGAGAPEAPGMWRGSRPKPSAP